MSCDVTADHVLLTRHAEGRRLSGLIDFGDQMVGDAEYEFVATYLSALDTDRSALDSCLAAYGHDGFRDRHFAGRMMAYTLLHKFPPPDLPPARLRRLRNAKDLDAATEALWGP